MASDNSLICSQVLMSAFQDKAIYQPGDCCINAARLLRALEKQGFDKTKARVLVIVKEQRKFPPVPAFLDSTLQPAISRNGDKTWNYHAVVEAEGKILDLDYSPKPLPAKEYFAAMFPDITQHPAGTAYNIQDRLSHVYLRAVSAQTYQSDMDSIKDASDRDKVFAVYRNQNATGQYPLVTAKDFLSQFD